jgi:DNA-binding response OmpR family regulator
MKILIVEDEDVYLIPVTKFLKQRGYVCETASDYKEALNKMLVYEYDCIILDINLPGGNGLDLLKELKKVKPEAPVIIASSRSTTEEKIEGLHLGSDDYIGKPYDFNELDARLNSIIRRKNFGGSDIIEFKEIQIITASQKTKVNDNPVTLTHTEYDLLLYFIAHKNKVVTKEAIAENLRGDNIDQADSYEFIYSHIRNLRKKLLSEGAGDYIHTVYGVGYNWYSE